MAFIADDEAGFSLREYRSLCDDAASKDANLITPADKIMALFDKIDGLEAELDSAIEVAFKRGATEWVRLNYPEHYKRLTDAA